MLFFDSTKRFFESWVAQLANYALITILAVAVAALLLNVVKSYTTATAALGGAITDRRCRSRVHRIRCWFSWSCVR